GTGNAAVGAVLVGHVHANGIDAVVGVGVGRVPRGSQAAAQAVAPVDGVAAHRVVARIAQVAQGYGEGFTFIDDAGALAQQQMGQNVVHGHGKEAGQGAIEGVADGHCVGEHVRPVGGSVGV